MNLFRAFRRSAAADHPGPAAGSAVASVATSAEPPQLARQGWRELPALQPQSLSLHPVAQSLSFTQGLAARAPAPTILRAPTHRPPVLDGRRGMVAGLATVAARQAVAEPPAAVEVGRPRLRRWFGRAAPAEQSGPAPEVSPAVARYASFQEASTPSSPASVGTATSAPRSAVPPFEPTASRLAAPDLAMAPPGTPAATAGAPGLPCETGAAPAAVRAA